MEKEKGQLTLFDCRKVVSGGKGGSWVCISETDILSHKQTLLRPDSSMHLLLNTLRKLDCYKLQLSDFSSTEIGRAVATIAGRHPRPEVTKLATALLHKWQLEFDSHLFSQLEYDTEAAAAAPEGNPAEFKLVAPPPPPPELPPQPTRVQPLRGDRATRLKDEQASLEGTDFEGISDSESEERVACDSDDDDDWQPIKDRRRKSGGSSGGASGSKLKKAKQ